MTLRKLLPCLSIVATILLSPLLGATTVFAQDAGQLDNNAGPVWIDRSVVAGGYELYVEAEASKLSLGSALVSVAVLNAVTGEPVPGARVIIHTLHEGYGETGWATALPVPERPEIYRARMKLELDGPWEVSVEVIGPLGRVQTHVGTVTIPPPRQYWVGSVVFAGMSVFLLAGLAYVGWTIRRAQKQRQAANAS
ncbi:MAG: FixH family protein [Chloroflexi bacterium]|nr:FixH family protein [Chloroflexota bacterium]